MVEGVQVTLPTYEEAVSGSRPPTSAESRVQIVLLEGQHTTAPEAGPSRPSYLKQQQLESAVVHPVPLSSSSPPPSSSTWALEHAGAAASSTHRIPAAGGDQHNLSLDSELDYSDGTTPTSQRFFFLSYRWLYADVHVSVCRYAIAEGGLKSLQNPGSLGKTGGSVWPVPINRTRQEFAQRNTQRVKLHQNPTDHPKAQQSRGCTYTLHFLQEFLRRCGCLESETPFERKPV